METMLSNIIVREADITDFEFFYSVKSELRDIIWTGHKAKPDYTKLYGWFHENLTNSQKRKIYIIQMANIPVGYIYLDQMNNSLFELSIGISEKISGKHIGRAALSKIVAMVRNNNPNAEFAAWIRQDNLASMKAFSHANFKLTSDYVLRWIDSLEKNVKLFKFINSTFAP